MKQQNVPAAFRLKNGLMFGFITSLINFLVSLALVSAGLMNYSGNSGGWISFLLIGLGIYLASERHKEKNNRLMRQMDVVVTAVWLGVFYGIVSMVFVFIQLQIDPSILAQMQNLLEMEMEKQNLEGEAYEQAMKIGQLFISPWFLGIAVCITSLIEALIAGVLLGYFLKKEAESPF